MIQISNELHTRRVHSCLVLSGENGDTLGIWGRGLKASASYNSTLKGRELVQGHGVSRVVARFRLYPNFSEDSMTLTAQFADALGHEIASQLGVHYDGYQPLHVGRTGRVTGNYMQFTDHTETRSTFGAVSLVQAREKLSAMRTKFQGVAA